MVYCLLNLLDELNNQFPPGILRHAIAKYRASEIVDLCENSVESEQASKAPFENEIIIKQEDKHIDKTSVIDEGVIKFETSIPEIGETKRKAAFQVFYLNRLSYNYYV